MSFPINEFFKISTNPDPTVFDGSADFVTDPFQVCMNYSWLIGPLIGALTNNGATYTLQMSSTGSAIESDWFDYDKDGRATDVSIEDALDDTHVTGSFLRIKYVSNGSSGNLQLPIQFKNP